MSQCNRTRGKQIGNLLYKRLYCNLSLSESVCFQFKAELIKNLGTYVYNISIFTVVKSRKMHRAIAKNSHVHFFHAHSVNVNMFSHVFHHSLSISLIFFICVSIYLCVCIFFYIFSRLRFYI